MEVVDGGAGGGGQLEGWDSVQAGGDRAGAGGEEGNGMTLGDFEGPVKGVLLMDRCRTGEGRTREPPKTFCLSTRICVGVTHGAVD